MNSESTVANGDAVSQQSLAWPPGFAGVIAKCIYENSYLPIPEISITAALALLAGVCGRGFRTHTDVDLALYIALVARSGIGKDAIHVGIPAIIDYAGLPDVRSAILRHDDFVSGPALHKELLRSPGFLNLQPEFGRKLKRMANPADTPMQDLRTIMTKAYGAKFLEGKKYSNSSESLLGVEVPAFSFLGETTPGTFLESLSSEMMEDGFLSRFLTISYDGDRPRSNSHCVLVMEDIEGMPQGSCRNYWRGMLTHAAKFTFPLNVPQPIPVGFRNLDAREKLDSFEEECRNAINSTTDESIRLMYNRAHLKALKIASILAASTNFYDPRIDLGDATWAMTIVRRDIATFQLHKKSGDIGDGDRTRQQKVIAILRDYINNPPPKSYKVPQGMRETGIVTHKYLQQRTSAVNVFAKHKLGASRALDDTLKALVAGGQIMNVQKDKMVEAYSWHGQCYRVLDLPD